MRWPSAGEQVWAQIPDLLAQRKASGYEQAVAQLAELRHAAVHRKQRAAFDERLTDLLKFYPPTPALQRRLREHKLIVSEYQLVHLGRNSSTICHPEPQRRIS